MSQKQVEDDCQGKLNSEAEKENFFSIRTELNVFYYCIKGMLIVSILNP
jgi:hypothetical protein